MNILRGLFRLIPALIAIAVGAILIVLTSFIPIKIKGFRLSILTFKLVARAILWPIGLQVHCNDVKRLETLEGFIFANHSTYLDILVLAHVIPVRFVAKMGIRSWPFVGQAAQAIGCVFVKRDNKSSRREARQAIINADRYPPIAIFPEGGKSSGEALRPFRYGAFEIAIQAEIPIIPCAIAYSRPDITIWQRGEHVMQAAWRLASRPGPLRVDLILLDTIHPTANDDAAQLAHKTHTAMSAILFSNKEPSLPVGIR